MTALQLLIVMAVAATVVTAIVRHLVLRWQDDGMRRDDAIALRHGAMLALAGVSSALWLAAAIVWVAR